MRQGSPFCRTLPPVCQPVPVTVYSAAPAAMRWTVILFSVTVPVLSVQITEAQPSVSTACRRLTSAFRASILRVASASAMVTVAGSPSGIAAIATVMPVMSMARGGSPRRMPARNTSPQTARQMTASTLPSSPRRFCSGVRSWEISVSIAEICPICVRLPVAMISASALPRVTDVPA